MAVIEDYLVLSKAILLITNHKLSPLSHLPNTACTCFSIENLNDFTISIWFTCFLINLAQEIFKNDDKRNTNNYQRLHFYLKRSLKFV